MAKLMSGIALAVACLCKGSHALSVPVDPWPLYYPYQAFTDSLPIHTYTDWINSSSTSMALGEERDVHVVLVVATDSLHPKMRLEYIRYFPDKDSLAQRQILYTATDSQEIYSPDIAIGKGNKPMVTFLLDRGCTNCSFLATGGIAVMSVDPATGAVLQVSTNPLDPRSTTRTPFNMEGSRPKVAWIGNVPTILYDARGVTGSNFLAAAVPGSGGWTLRKAFDFSPDGSLYSSFTVVRNAKTLSVGAKMNSSANAQCIFQEGGKRFCTPTEYNGFLRNDDPSIAEDSNGVVHLFWQDDKVVAASGSAKDSGGMRELLWNPADNSTRVLTYGRWSGSFFPMVTGYDRKTGLTSFLHQALGGTGATLYTKKIGNDTLFTHYVPRLGYAEGDVALEIRDSLVVLATIRASRLFITSITDSVRFVPPTAIKQVAGEGRQLQAMGRNLKIPQLEHGAELSIQDTQGKIVWKRTLDAGNARHVAIPSQARGFLVASLRDASGLHFTTKLLIP
ncbi:MAG: hypothetical protein RL318_228 [Fibrobacterota bacterium]|jgi:hypothetical protein